MEWDVKAKTRMALAGVPRILPEIRQLIEAARQHVAVAANPGMVNLYWNIGIIITRDIQKDEKRAGYGDQLIEELGKRLTSEYGQGFSARNLCIRDVASLIALFRPRLASWGTRPFLRCQRIWDGHETMRFSIRTEYRGRCRRQIRLRGADANPGNGGWFAAVGQKDGALRHECMVPLLPPVMRDVVDEVDLLILAFGSGLRDPEMETPR